MTPAFLHPFTRPSRTQFVSIVSGDGAVVTDSDGKQYVDAMASLWYCSIGHGRREMAETIAAQAGAIAAYSCFEPFTNPAADALAERIVELSPIPDARVFLCQSGSEAVDTAMKLARLTHLLDGHPERTLIVSRMRGYHGTNYGGTTAQGLPPNKEGWGPLLPDVVQVPGDDVEALASLMAERGHQVAAVIAEPVQGAGGVWPAQDGYLQAVRRLCDQHGALLIFDEVITGFGRLGNWFGSEFFGVTPDITTFAKAVTSGYQPLGGVVVGGAVRAALESDPNDVLKTGFTYSGHATCCAAATKNLEIMTDEGLLSAAERIATRLGGGLRALADDGVIAGVRGVQGVWAAAMNEGQDAVAVRDAMLQAGVITRAIGDHSLAFCPPLVITDAQIDRIVDALDSASGHRR